VPSPSGTQFRPLVLTPHLPFGFAQGRLGPMNAVASRLSFKSVHEDNSEDLRNCDENVAASASSVISEMSPREITQ
jgi:hypothetical protein